MESSSVLITVEDRVTDDEMVVEWESSCWRESLSKRVLETEPAPDSEIEPVIEGDTKYERESEGVVL